MKLNAVQRRQVDAATAALAAGSFPADLAGLAYRAGVLEWHLFALLALVADLAGCAPLPDPGRLAAIWAESDRLAAAR